MAMFSASLWTRRQILGGVAAAGVTALAAGDAEAAVIECTLIVDEASGRPLVEKGACDQRFTPMSTFKLPLAVIGYDTGILENAHAPRWDYRPEFNAVKRARKATDPTIWLEESIVWYSQEITCKLGKDRFASYVARLNYGNGDVAGQPGQDGLTQSWLHSSLEISPREQTDFIRALVGERLPVSRQAQVAARAIVPVFEADGGWRVHGKTGSGWLGDAKGKIDRNRPLGWFVGWAEKDGRRIVFARLRLGTKRASGMAGPVLRDVFLTELPGLVK